MTAATVAVVADTLNVFFDRLDALFQEGDQQKIERFLHQTMDGYEIAGMRRSAEYATVENELACFLRGVSRYEESERAFEDALAILEERGLRGTVQFATVVINRAGLCRLRGDHGRAAELFLEAKQLLEEIGETGHYAYASVLNNLSLVYQDTGELDKALEMTKAAYEYFRDRDASEHELATSLVNIAAVYLRMNDLENAEAYSDRALAMYDAMEEENVHHAAALTASGVIRFRAGDGEAALERFRRSLGLTEHFFGKNIEYAVTEHNIASVLRQLGRTAEALETLTAARSDLANLLGGGHPRVRSWDEEIHELEAMAK